MFTSHGHQIIGTTAEPRSEGQKIARCGGTGLCGECSREAAQALNRVPTYNSNGDMITRFGQIFRQVGWQINGGVNDGFIIKKDEKDVVEKLQAAPHGGFSPVYIEIDTD